MTIVEGVAKEADPMPVRTLALISLLLAALGCGGAEPRAERPRLGEPIARTEGAAIADAPGWTWVPFPDASCTDATLEAGAYRFGASATGLAVSWGSAASTTLVVFLQGGGACWDFFSCGGARSAGIDKTASTGPFGPAEFAASVYARYPRSWVRRERLPPSLADATVVFVPYCTGDVHSGDRVTTYASPVPGLAPVTWRHVGHANAKAFLARLGATFPNAARVVLAGSSAGGFGALANYEAFRAYWPGARAYLVDDSGPPLAGDAIPAATREAWYASWNMGASLDGPCPGCRGDMSEGLRRIAERHPEDRVALVSSLQDAVIRGFFGTYTLLPTPTLAPMSASAFEAALRSLATDVMAPTPAQRSFLFPGSGHPALEDPTTVTAPSPGLEAWLELMLSDAPEWTSAAP